MRVLHLSHMTIIRNQTRRCSIQSFNFYDDLHQIYTTYKNQKWIKLACKSLSDIATDDSMEFETYPKDWLPVESPHSKYLVIEMRNLRHIITLLFAPSRSNLKLVSGSIRLSSQLIFLISTSWLSWVRPARVKSSLSNQAAMTTSTSNKHIYSPQNILREWQNCAKICDPTHYWLHSNQIIVQNQWERNPFTLRMPFLW